MFALHAGREPVVPSRVLCARSSVLAAMLGLAGCASAPQQYAAQNIAVAQAVEVEADGRPAQAVPTSRLRSLPDEPVEPFSKNYGGKNPAADKMPAAVEPVNGPSNVPPKIPRDLPPVFRKKLMQAMAESE
jgi:hypothetical protein